MSVTSRSPLRVAGANVNSGSVNTGEQLFTFGGGQAATLYSGMVSGVSLLGAPGAVNGLAGGADVLLVAGAGRLKDVLIHQSLISGQSIVFYDAGVVSSGGPFPGSGTKIVGIIPASPPAGLSGTFVAAGPYLFDVPYQSGLCVNLKSGQAGFTATFNPETN